MTLQQEFQQIEEMLGSYVEYLEEVLNPTENVLAFTGPNADGLPVDSSAVMVYDAMKATTPNLPSGALQFLIASGEVHVIQNDDLRLQLGRWPSQYEDAEFIP